MGSHVNVPKRLRQDAHYQFPLTNAVERSNGQMNIGVFQSLVITENKVNGFNHIFFSR